MTIDKSIIATIKGIARRRLSCFHNNNEIAKPREITLIVFLYIPTASYFIVILCFPANNNTESLLSYFAAT